MRVAPAPFSAARNDKRFGGGQILDYSAGLFFAYNGSCGYGYENILAVFSVEFAVLTVGAVFRREFSALFEFYKRVFAGVDDKNDISAASAVAAVRSALCDIFFPSEGNAAVPSPAGFDVYIDLIHKHSGSPPITRKNEKKSLPLHKMQRHTLFDFDAISRKR